MHIGRLIKQTDFVLAFLVFVLASSAAWWVYAGLREQQLKGGLLNEPLRVGKRQFALLNGPDCVGALFSELSDEGGLLDLNLGGEIRAVFRGKPLTIHLKVEASFNVLGQMGGAIINLRTEDLEARVGMLEIDPITVTVNAVVRGEKYKHKWFVPGPVELKRAGPGRYKLYYQPLRALNNPYVVTLMQQSKQVMDLKIMPMEDRSAGCIGQELASLNLDAFARRLEAQLRAVLSLFSVDIAVP